MSNYEHEHGHGPKIEAGQILNPDCFPPPNELVCIQVPKVFDQVSLRDCVTRCIPLRPLTAGVEERHHHHEQDECGCPSDLAFEGATNFDIVEVRVISKTDSLTRPGFKKLKLFVKIKYTIHFTEGDRQFRKEDEASFNITVNEIYCPNCITQIGVIHSPENFWDNKPKTIDPDGTFIKVEALAEAFNDSINRHDVLTLDIGVFFIIKCECVVQLLIPAYGYCPVPPEQRGGVTIQNCTTFNDKTRTPFPTKFFPDQKWNPLDRKDGE